MTMMCMWVARAAVFQDISVVLVVESEITVALVELVENDRPPGIVMVRADMLVEGDVHPRQDLEAGDPQEAGDHRHSRTNTWRTRSPAHLTSHNTAACILTTPYEPIG